MNYYKLKRTGIAFLFCLLWIFLMNAFFNCYVKQKCFSWSKDEFVEGKQEEKDTVVVEKKQMPLHVFPMSIKSKKVVYDSLFEKKINFDFQENLMITLVSKYTKEETDTLAKERVQEFKKVFFDKYNPNRVIATVKQDTSFQPTIEVSFKEMTPKDEKHLMAYINKYILYTYFDKKTFKFRTPPAFIKYLSLLKSHLQKYPNKKISVIGHTDNIGPRDANVWISKKRAEVVANYIVAQGGIPQTAITLVEGRGFDEPLVPNINRENRKKNKRIEIIINQ